MNLRELQERRAAAVVEMRGLADKAEAETRDLNADEDAKFGTLKTEIGDLDKRIGRAQTIAEAERAAPAISLSGRPGDGNFETRAREFSITKAIGAALGEDVDAGFEREISAEVRRRSGRRYVGIAVPDEVFLERRAFGDSTMLVNAGSPGGAAAPLYPNVLRPDLFIDRLRAGLIVARLGATVLNDLVGDQDIPRQTGSATAQWVAEDEALTDTAQTFDDVTLSPKTVGAITSYSRRTLINATPSIEQIVRNDLASVVASAIDTAALFGDGSGNRPVGVRNQANVNVVSPLTPTWPAVLDFLTKIQSDNADLGTLGWALAPDAAAVLRATLREAGIAAGYLMDAPGALAGYPAAMSTVLSTGGSPGTSTLIFGAWAQLLIGYWSGLDVLVNPYSDAAYARGRVMIRVMQDVDVAVRHPESFAYGELSA